MRQLVRYFAILAISFLNLLPATPVILAQTNPSSFKDIRAVYTAEFGVPHPNGFAFLPQSKGFILWGAQSDSQEVQLISDYEDPSGSLTLPVIVEDPLAAAFDSRSNSLVMWNNGAGELVTVGIDQNGVPDASGKNVVRYTARAFGIRMAQGIAFDPASGRLFILDAKGPRIVSVTPDPSESFDADVASRDGKINRINLNGFENTQFRGLAFNPKNSHLYVGAPSEQKVYEFDQNGEAVSTLDLGSLQLTTIQALTFAPSADTTDDPTTMNLFVLDSGVSDTQTLKQSSGQILELTLEPQTLPGGTTLLPSTLVRTFSTSNTVWNPSSPDPSGIDYWPPIGGLIIDDSEVDEMSNYFTGKNVFLSTRSGTLTGTCSTTNLSRSGFSNEPTGLAVNPNNNNIFISDDDARKVFEIRLGADRAYCTADDTVVSVGTTTDTEDVAYGNNTLFISGGTDAEVFMFNLGANGVLGGGDDGPVTHFDTGVLGFSDLEGIGYNSDSGTLFIVSTSSNDRYLGEVTTTGTLLRAYDLSFMGTASNIRSDVAVAPSSQNPAVKNIYIASRGVDNVPNPNENDGKVWEISFIKDATFSDVATDYWAWMFVERLYNAGITGGCNTAPLMYCPEVTVTRAQMAVFLLRGIHGSSYSPPDVAGSTGFGDVPTDYWSAAWIKELAAEGITGGCGSGNYCPEYPVTRDQMAVFLLRSEHGAFYSPPDVAGSTGFGDVTPEYWSASWIKQLVAEGITAGCGTGTYCPEMPVTRAQMAVFLVRTFNLP